MSQFSSFRGSPNLQCPVTVSSSLSGGPSSGSPVPGTVLGSSSSSTPASLQQQQQHQQSQPSSSSRMAVTSGAVVVRPPGSPASSTASPGQPSTAHPPGSGGSGPGSAGSGRCCDTGRPIFTDPITGQTVCSCQYELLGSYPRLGALPSAALSMYSAPYAAAAAAAASEGMAAYFPGLGAEQAPFYTPTASGLELKENLGAGAAAAWPYPSVYHPYDAAFAGYSFNGYGMDLNGARRKNATRETTSTLKAWLNEHKKNPYPTKGEKIMLAIITKMTLTQVSTWFANARRRLKKENKMTWEPRNRVEDEDNNNEDDDSGRKSVDDKDRLDSKDSGTGSSEDGERGSATHRLDLLHGSGGPGPCPGGSLHGGPGGGGGGRPESEWSESRADSGPDSPECLYDPREPRHHPLHLQHPYLASAHARLQLRHPSPDSLSPVHQHTPASTSTSAHGAVGPAVKPRIWSLADMASKDPAEHHHHHPHPHQQSHQPHQQGLPPPYAPGGGKIVSPLASRLPPHHPLHPAMHPGAQFAMRPPPDFYRNFYGGPHLAPGDMSLLETYQRTLGGLGGVMAAAAASAQPVQPLASAGPPRPHFSANGSPLLFQQQHQQGQQGQPTAQGLPGPGGPSPAPSTASSNGSDRSPSRSQSATAELKSPGRV